MSNETATVTRPFGSLGTARLIAAPIVASLLATLTASCSPARRPDCHLTYQPVHASNGGVDKVDLLLMIDNSSAMRDNQTLLLAQFHALTEALTSPPCVSAANPTPHACSPGSPDEMPQFVRVRDLHVGVVSSDLGTPGSSVQGCSNSDLGDDGRLNPIRNGQALSTHEPWATAPPTYGRPADCTDPNQFPSFITFDSTTNLTTFTHDFQCNAGLYVLGCGLESPLEAVFRAVNIHEARVSPGSTSPNAGFIRDDAILAIVILTDEEDGSVRDCRFAADTPCDGHGAIDVYDPASTAWSSRDLNLRFYMYQPCGPQDPTWPVERYVDGSNPTRGLLALKPGHPERIVFAAIAGVPLLIPTMGSGANERVDWNGLLGTPSARGPEDFCGRDTSGLGSLPSAEGPISMMQSNPDANCGQRTVPACRREGSTYAPMNCTGDQQYFAWPSRRIVEVARRFDESPICNGAPCNNGIVASVCGSDYADAVSRIVTRIQSRLSWGCSQYALRSTVDSQGDDVVQCIVRVRLPAGEDACDPMRGLQDPHDRPSPAYDTVGGVLHRVCVLNQVAIDPTTRLPVAGTGWYYQQSPDPEYPHCNHQVSFTTGAALEAGSTYGLECPAPPPGVDAGVCD